MDMDDDNDFLDVYRIMDMDDKHNKSNKHNKSTDSTIGNEDFETFAQTRLLSSTITKAILKVCTHCFFRHYQKNQFFFHLNE